MKTLLTPTILLFLCLLCGAQNSNTLDANDISAHYNANGALFWDFQNTQYFVDTDDGYKPTIFSSELWIGGIDDGGQLKLAAQSYRQSGNDFWPGPLDSDGNIDQSTSEAWNKVWKVNRAEIQSFITDFDNGDLENPLEAQHPSIAYWPAIGNPYVEGNNGISIEVEQAAAPFIDVDNDGMYDPWNGDYPDITGDQMLWFVFNDNLAPHTESGGEALKIEVQASAYAFDFPQDEVLDKTTFLNYKVIYKGDGILSNTHLGSFVDFDLGQFDDDFVGCDPELNAFYAYNGDASDNGFLGFGNNPPFQMVKMLNRPMSSFIYYNSDFSVLGTPELPQDYYEYLNGNWKDGTPVTFGGDGYGGDTPYPFMFSGETWVEDWEWSECTEGNPPGDRRGIGVTGPFTLSPGQIIEWDLAYITYFLPEGFSLCAELPEEPLTHIQDLFDNGFEGIIPTSIASIEHEMAIDLYPNPAQDFLNISVSESFQNGNLNIFDAQGKLVLSTNLIDSGTILDISGLHTGLYLAQLETERGSTFSSRFSIVD